MKKNSFVVLIVFLLIETLSTLAYAANIPDATTNGAVPIGFQSKRHPFTNVKALQAGEELTVSGATKRTMLGDATANPGHVDVVVYDGGGAILAKASHMVRFYTFTAKNQTRTVANLAEFNFKFPLRISEGTKLRLAFHESSPFTWYTVFDCGDNRAIAQASN